MKSLIFRIASVSAITFIAAFAGPIVRADTMSADVIGVGFTLVLTENSSTSLVVTSYDGTGGTAAFTVTPNGIDNWTVTANNFPTTFFYDFTADFTEPLPEVGEVNEAYAGGNVTQHSSFTVESDEPIAQYQGCTTTTYPNGGLSNPIGQDGIFLISLRFIDNATASETAPGVADTGSSLSFLAMSIGGLVAAARIRKIRLA